MCEVVLSGVGQPAQSLMVLGLIVLGLVVGTGCASPSVDCEEAVRHAQSCGVAFSANHCDGATAFEVLSSDCETLRTASSDKGLCWAASDYLGSWCDPDFDESMYGIYVSDQSTLDYRCGMTLGQPLSFNDLHVVLQCNPPGDLPFASVGVLELVPGNDNIFEGVVTERGDRYTRVDTKLTYRSTAESPVSATFVEEGGSDAHIVHLRRLTDAASKRATLDGAHEVEDAGRIAMSDGFHAGIDPQSHAAGAVHPSGCVITVEADWPSDGTFKLDTVCRDGNRSMWVRGNLLFVEQTVLAGDLFVGFSGSGTGRFVPGAIELEERGFVLRVRNPTDGSTLSIEAARP